jgi:hypothetical protein
MDFTVEFYVSVGGRSPVHEFFDELKQSDCDDFAAVLAGLARLRHSQSITANRCPRRWATVCLNCATSES